MGWERKSAAERSALNLPAVLIIMDGYGLAEPGEGNAIWLADTPHLDYFFEQCPTTKLEASGEAVGLPEGQMGNSEVGHLNIGAGRIVFQELTRINRACADGSIAENDVINNAFAVAAKPGAALHFMGLLSDGGVHSSNEHLYALLGAAKRAGVAQVFVHCFMDGRDVPPSSGAGYVAELQGKLDELNGDGFDASIATIEGRYYAMDRDKRWERIARAWDAIAHAKGVSASGPVQAMEDSYAREVTDEFVEPVALYERGVRDGDAVVFFNFRPDRARQITRVFVNTDEELAAFGLTSEQIAAFGERPQVSFVCLTEYDPEIPAPIAFAKSFPDNVLADVLADQGLAQYHIAETEKYAHVTFFLNGGREEPKPGEQRQLVASPKVATYDLQPEMSEPEVAEKLATAISEGVADVYIVNFANCDMVGHTGIIPAAKAAVEAVDTGIAQVLAAVEEQGGFALICADHGNADKMIADDGTPHTAHTTAKVPFCLVDYCGTGMTLDGREGALCNIAPTLLDLIGIDAPSEMEGESLACDR